jgi:hypothetical protein
LGVGGRGRNKQKEEELNSLDVEKEEAKIK